LGACAPWPNVEPPLSAINRKRVRRSTVDAPAVAKCCQQQTDDRRLFVTLGDD